MRKAMKSASVDALAPNFAAITISLTKPSSRDTSVKKLTTDRDLNKPMILNIFYIKNAICKAN
jgi:hypothetical protein